MPKFSVVIAVYNKEKHLAKTLQSVFAQTFQDFEVVLVNDGSTDGSEKVIKQFKDSRLRYYHQENKGAAAGRNAAINKATAPYIALLDADDLWEPTYLETMDTLIKTHPNENVFACAVAVETKGKTIKSAYSIPNLTANKTYIVDYFKSSFFNTILTSSSTIFNKNILQKVSNYDTTLESGEDTDFWIKIGLNFKIVFINKQLVTYRYYSQSLSNRIKSVKHKPSYESYQKFEEENPALKKFLDLNRYSLAILAKLDNDRINFKKFFEKIDLNNLNKKQRLLLKLSPKSTRFLYSLKNFAERFGIKLSAFK